MSKRSVPFRGGHIAIPLERAEGRLLKGLSIYQTEDTLNVDLQFENGIAIEIICRLGFVASANVLEYVNGDSHVLNHLDLRSRR